MRVLEGEGWQQPGIFYVQIGTEDSLGASLPPGAIASVEPLAPHEAECDPRYLYLLQCGNGYRCCGCRLSRGKLFLSVLDQRYDGPEEFPYPGAVRIAGRIRMFYVTLPVPRYPSLSTLPMANYEAPLVLPWEQRNLAALLRAEDRRFRRTQGERQRLQ